MQKILGYVRKAVQQYDLIQNGDRIAVAVSGGKDSLVLLKALAEYRRFSSASYDLTAITIDPRFNDADGDYTSVQSLCNELRIPYIIEPTDIAKIVFDIRKEQNPCSLCAKLRRGALHGCAKSHGCNKLALGHNNDDVIETFIMNLFQTGSISCFAPKSYLTDRDITVIRPLCLAPEKQVISAAKRNNLQIVTSACPADKHTKRQEIKEWLNGMERSDKGFKLRIFGAMSRANVSGWGVSQNNKTEMG